MKASFLKLNAGPCKVWFVGGVLFFFGGVFFFSVKPSWWRLLNVSLFVYIKEV